MTDSILVTGASGYIGGRLVPALLEHDYSVCVMARDPERLQGRSWGSQVEVRRGDALEPGSLATALQGIRSAYYLIHSMGAAGSFEQRDITAARNFGHAAANAGVERIIYLGGLGDPGEDLSDHLRSRHETGDALREAGVPVTEFQAAIVVGSGSISFEMIRYLVDRLPLMIAPRWVYTRVQPIAVQDVIDYLVKSLQVPQSADKTIQIGGTDVLTYGDMMLGYADERGLRRHIIPVPVLTPRLSSYWVNWVTPIPAHYARPLIEGLRSEVIVRDDLAQELFPGVTPLSYRQAVRAALEKLRAGRVETAWSDALASSVGDRAPVRLEHREGMILEQRMAAVDASAERVYESFTSLGGEQGWLYANWAWRLRGLLDRLIGGVGLRRGRRSEGALRPGDAVDFWRVEAIEENRLLRLRAEMRLPGQAWLEFRATPRQDGSTGLTQIAYFAPKGLVGLLYWYMLYPLHSLIFSGLIRALKERSEEDHA